MIKNQIHMYLNFVDPNIKIFRDFRVFVLSPIPKSENQEITEIHQKSQNTEIWEYNFQNSWNIVQMTSFSKWFSYHFSHVPCFFFQEILTPPDLLNWLFFSVYFSFNAQKVEIVIKSRFTCIWTLLIQK